MLYLEHINMLRFKIFACYMLLRREFVWANGTHGIDNKLMTLLKGSMTICYYVVWLQFAYNLCIVSRVDLVNFEDVV